MSETESAAVAATPDPAAAAEPKPRRLRGHKKGAVTCCVASSARPGVVASSGEDGCLCWFDLRTKDVLLTMEAANKPISSICFKPGNEDCVYISAGNEILSFDVRMGTQSKPLETYNYNRDEINQIAVSSKGFLAAADDSGDVKIVNTIQKCLYKRIREAHTSICSSVQFIPWRPWTAITGGLDSKLVAWDFSKGRTLFSIDYGSPELQNGSSSGSAGQCFNPAFVHSVEVSEEGILGGLYKSFPTIAQKVLSCDEEGISAKIPGVHLFCSPRQGFPRSFWSALIRSEANGNGVASPDMVSKHSKEELIAFFRDIQTSIAESSPKASKRTRKQPPDPLKEVHRREQSHGRGDGGAGDVSEERQRKVMNLEDMNVADLRELARARRMRGYSKLKKGELIDRLKGVMQ
ncbi:unnamed protein product [Miscanthus lutarioriparius]|uniref:Rho termination factor-like N-terminal domain-containing protein n=1 Tax=Miscanthus lutarioriparius TaxID=422564 RepID=A0A811PCR0_9POAL|nr:unnamed protein product [Miscanthus lutarioriparius]